MERKRTAILLSSTKHHQRSIDVLRLSDGSIRIRLRGYKHFVVTGRGYYDAVVDMSDQLREALPLLALSGSDTPFGIQVPHQARPPQPCKSRRVREYLVLCIIEHPGRRKGEKTRASEFWLANDEHVSQRDLDVLNDLERGDCACLAPVYDCRQAVTEFLERATFRRIEDPYTTHKLGKRVALMFRVKLATLQLGEASP